MKKNLRIGIIVGTAIGALVGASAVARHTRPQPEASLPPPEAPSAVVSVPVVAPTASEAPKPSKRLLGQYTTVYKTDMKDARVTNIELSASKLDNSVIEPGKAWSFNKTVGPRTKELGFDDAPTLLMGEVIPGVGGGVCQVSSTLFAAALHIGLDPVRRVPHSRPSSYVPKGLDAAVNYPEQCWKSQQDQNICFDLQLKNPYSFPVEVRTTTTTTSPTTRELTVMLFGDGDVAKVETKWIQYDTPGFKRVWRRNIWKAGTWKRKKQKGEAGLTGARIIDTLWPDGHKTHEILVSRYRPQNEVWWVGKDWDGGDPWGQ